MCDLLPEFENCCVCVNLRIAMLLMSVLAIITGGIVMGVSIQKHRLTFSTVQNVTNTTGMGPVKETAKKLLIDRTQVNQIGILFSGILYMFGGILLLMGTLLDNNGFINLFVWITFVNAVFGIIMVLSVAHQCMAGSSCMLDDMDWLSAAGLLVITLLYLGYWIYLVSVANTYVMYNTY